MGNTEFNNTQFDNTAQTFNFSPNNIATSDELLAPETYDYEKPTNFSKLKSKIKVAKIAVFSVTVTVTGGAMVVGLTQNGFGAKTPIVENPSFKVENKQLIYNFTLKDVKNYQISLKIDNNNNNIFTAVFEKDGTYQNTYNLSAYLGTINVKLDYSNNVDHAGNLYTQSFTI